MPSPATSPQAYLSPLAARVLDAVTGAARPLSSAMLAWRLELHTADEWREMTAELDGLRVAGLIHQVGISPEPGSPRAWSPGRGD